MTPEHAVPLPVAVNMLWCRPGLVGGSEEYLVRQLAGVLATGRVRLRIAASGAFATAHPELFGPGSTGAGSPVGRQLGIDGRAAWPAGSAGPATIVTPPIAVTRRPARIAAETFWLPRQLGDAAIVHHGGGTVPPRLPRLPTPPAVLTIHDLQYLALPQYFSTARRRYLQLSMPRSVAAAAVVAVPSEFVRTTVLDAFGDRVAADRVVVVPHGFDPPPPNARTEPAALRRRYGLGGRRVVVFPAITHPHKGHAFLLDVAAATPDDTVFVLLGGGGAADEAVAAKIVANRLEARVVRPGRVSTADRDGLLALAAALVFPSEYEGFGAPVIEAMGLGTPVIASDRTALPEIVGDGGLVLPLDVAMWVDALASLDRLADVLRARGHRRAAEFTMAASGTALLAAYEQAA